MAHDPTEQSTKSTDSSIVSPARAQSDMDGDVDAGDEPETCPVCDVAYDSVSIHDAGLMVNLLDNERYRRVCFEPVVDTDGRPLVRFFHHTHGQALDS